MNSRGISFIPGMSACALALLLSACAQAGPPAAGSIPLQPRYGGILRNVLDRDPGSCDQSVATGGDRVSGNACGGMLNGLLKMTTGDVIEPDLAERWEASGDGKAWTFHLRPDVYWHDRKPFTADDVVYNFDRWLRPPKGIALGGSSLVFQTIMEQAEKVDDHTVRFHMKAPPASFLLFLSDHRTFLYPKHVMETLDPPTMTAMKSVVGTGPFKYKREIRGSTYEMERNANYFREGLPYLDGVRYNVLPDPSARLAALTTGQVDVYSGAEIPPEDARTIRSSPQGDRISVLSLYNLNYQYAAVNMKVQPFDNPKVREAVWRALDQREAIRVLGLGEGVAGYRMFTDGKWSLPEDELARLQGMGPREQELARARQLLAEAGYPGGFTIDKPIPTRNVTRDEDLGVWVVQQLGQIGIKAETRALERAALDQARRNRDYAISAIYSTMALDDPEFGLGPYSCGHPDNYINWCDPRFDELYTAQNFVLDEAKRKQVVQEAQRLLVQTNAYIPLFWVAFNVGQWDYVQGWDPRSTNKWCYCMIVFDTTWLAK